MHVRSVLAVLVVVGVSAFAGTARAADATVDEGIYACVGQNPTGGDYTGKVAVMKIGDTYELKWTIGADSYTGVGLLIGDRLAVGFTSGSSPGVVVYKVGKGKLEGTWSVVGSKGKILTETLTAKTDAAH